MESLRVLVADDESIIRLDLRETLRKMGHEVIAEAGDGLRAVEMARQLKPDLVILDIKMPEMDGIDAAKLIAGEKIAPVVLVTAYSQIDLVQRAQEAGVFGYVVKPFKEVGPEARGHARHRALPRVSVDLAAGRLAAGGARRAQAR
jgi:two-component system, response regulator PdtaR